MPSPTEPRRQPRHVRALARFAANSRCPTARAAFAAQIDLDPLLDGTRLAMPYGQSPFAFRRGDQFEESLREDDHSPLYQAITEALGLHPPPPPRPLDLRSSEKSAVRHTRTLDALRRILSDAPGAPTLLDGAVLSRPIAGAPAFFEADAVAACLPRPAAPGELPFTLHVGEVKSFPTVDGQADPDKLGAAVAQAAVYVILLRAHLARLLAEQGHPDPDAQAAALVSDDVLIITPRNTGMRPTATVHPAAREIDRARRLLATLDGPTEAPADARPALVRLHQASGEERVVLAIELIQQFGNQYSPSCLSSCGFGRLCREQAWLCGAVTRQGGAMARTLPGVSTLDRAADLVEGDAPLPGEVQSAQALQRAERLLDQLSHRRLP